MDLLIFFPILALLAYLLFQSKKRDVSTSEVLLYRRQKTLFTKAERSFLGALELALPDNFRVLGKVRVADVITPVSGMSKKQWWIAFNKISAKHFDYVLCEKDTLNIVAAIELDDKSHGSEKQQRRDFLLNKACASANLKLIRFPAQHNYQIQDIQDRLTSHLTL